MLMEPKVVQTARRLIVNLGGNGGKGKQIVRIRGRRFSRKM